MGECGMKFDKDKAKWELVPMRYLNEIIRNIFSSNTIAFYNIMNIFNKVDIMNMIIESINSYGEYRTFHHRNKEILSTISSGILYYLIGRVLTKEEIEGDRFCNYKLDIIGIENIKAIADIYTYGAKKYSPNNWMKVEPDRYYAALMRHVLSAAKGEIYDSESGFMHLHHALWNVIALMWFEDYGPKELKYEGDVPKEVIDSAKEVSKMSNLIKPKKVKKD